MKQESIFDYVIDGYKKDYNRIEYLVNTLNQHTEAYDKGTPTISDKEWDTLFFELVSLERATGIILDNSPTQVIHYNIVNELKKVEHNHKMLSLAKTKDIDEVKAFAKGKDILPMCKMDGLTCSLTYENGRLIAAETRGNGVVGEDILHNAQVIPSIPKYISYMDRLVVDGEIICTYKNFEKFADEYKNPRNFAAGSIRLLDAKECEKRNLTFVAWEVIEGYDEFPLLYDRLIQLFLLGFSIGPTWPGDIDDAVTHLKFLAEEMGYPIDGLVFKFNDVAYGKTLGETAHHFNNAIAYKFYDELYKTTMLGIEWSMGRTGTLTPVALLDPVDIDGSTVSRASLHNLSIIRELYPVGPYIGQEVDIYKSNMIIPQVYCSYPMSTIKVPINIPFPTTCPICGGEVQEITENDSAVLKCMNPSCSGKLLNRLEHFCSKKGLDIKGLSKATLEKLMNWGWIDNFSDIFTLKDHRSEWIQKTGFGVKSVDKILEAIEASKNCNLDQFIAALGIPLVGSAAAKELVKHFPTWNDYITAVETKYHFYDIPNFGAEMHSAIISYDYTIAKLIANNFLSFNTIESNITSNATLENKIFVITGKLTHFKNRDELTSLITSLGGKVSGSVSRNTSYLINNDVQSTSSKNKTAQSLNVPIISEEDFIQTFGIN